MDKNQDLFAWLNNNLSDVLSFPVPQDLTEYILTIENDRDIDDYLKTLLDLSNPRHKAFLEKFKIIRHAGENKDKNDQTSKEGAKKKKKGGGDTLKEDGKANDENEEPEKKEDVKVKKKNKFVNLYSAEGASKDVIFLKGRHMCECQGSKHRLINNCLKCGRIVCAQEGSGPCLYCGKLVCSAEEQNILNEKTIQSIKLYDSLMDSSKTGELEKALEQRNRLLEFDRTTQQRSKVIDDESDYFSSTSSWLTKKERDRLLKKEEEAHAKKHASRLEKKVTLDFAGRQIIEEVEDAEFDENFFRVALDEINENIGGSYAHPDFQASIQPVFVSDKSNVSSSTQSKNPDSKNLQYRVQDKELLLISDNGACLSMHQPWASLLVCGIKKHEGRTWYSSHRGRLWIASASKVPTKESIKECEEFYKAITGDDNLNFPSSYPTSCLLGCVSLVDCLPQEEYRSLYPDGESESPFVFICEEPMELDIRFPMSGSHKIYKLDSRIHQAAKKALIRVAKKSQEQS